MIVSIQTLKTHTQYIVHGTFGSALPSIMSISNNCCRPRPIGTKQTKTETEYKIQNTLRNLRPPPSPQKFCDRLKLINSWIFHFQRNVHKSDGISVFSMEMTVRRRDGCRHRYWDKRSKSMPPFMAIEPMMQLTDESRFPVLIILRRLNQLKIDHSPPFNCRAVVRELIETEEEFGRDLLLVVEHYIKTVDTPKTPKIITDNKEIIFGNFKQIAEFHNTWVIVESFCSLCELFSLMVLWSVKS